MATLQDRFLLCLQIGEITSLDCLLQGFLQFFYRVVSQFGLYLNVVQYSFYKGVLLENTSHLFKIYLLVFTVSVHAETGLARQ